MDTFASTLKAMGACCGAVEWVGDRDLATAWAECEMSEWMLWLAGRMAGRDGWSDKTQIVMAAADIAEKVLHLVREQDKAVCQKAIRAARDFANRTIDRSAAYAARAAAYAAYAADAAARAAAYAAAYAADAAAYAAHAAADAAYAAARAAKRIEICDIIRRRITVGTLG